LELIKIKTFLNCPQENIQDTQLKMSFDPKYKAFQIGKWESLEQITSTYLEHLKDTELGIPEVIIFKEQAKLIFNFDIYFVSWQSSTGRKTVGLVCRECRE
jgi:hypothetical protein